MPDLFCGDSTLSHIWWIKADEIFKVWSTIRSHILGKVQVFLNLKIWMFTDLLLHFITYLHNIKKVLLF